MDIIAKLETYDAIRTVKAKYCRFLDSKDWVVWAQGKSPVPGVASITGYGHYRERCVREGGAWKIASLRLTRLHVDMEPDPAER